VELELWNWYCGTDTVDLELRNWNEGDETKELGLRIWKCGRNCGTGIVELVYRIGTMELRNWNYGTGTAKLGTVELELKRKKAKLPKN
jgi:hypothetical protein